MSGPVGTADADPGATGTGSPDAVVVEVSPGRSTEVGGIPVRRSLPQRGRRTVGAWCFLDHFGAPGAPSAGMQVGPHPHIGLQTVTWLVEGEVLHRDSLGSEQRIRPGQLNLMTAGGGVAHAEEPTGPGPVQLHGAQLWVAQPESTRHGEAAFEHHADLPVVDLGGAEATVLVGALGGARSPARTDTPLVGAEVLVGQDGRSAVPLDPAFEHAVVVLDGEVDIEGAAARPGELAYLGLGRGGVELAGRSGTRLLLLGGLPFEDRLVMWWNFVGRSQAELTAAYGDWEEGDRFGPVASSLPRIPAPRPHWLPNG
jgi:quercetin 2,3-dioxygenase